MSDPKKPDHPVEAQPNRTVPEGPVPGMPPASDPLLNPMPRPSPGEIKPRD